MKLQKNLVILGFLCMGIIFAVGTGKYVQYISTALVVGAVVALGAVGENKEKGERSRRIKKYRKNKGEDSL